MARSVTTGFVEWQAALHAQHRQVQQGAQRAVGAALGEQLDVANHLVPIGTRRYTRDGIQHPGYLKTRNQTRIVENGPYRYTGEYFNDAPYAAYVALGTYKMRARDFVTPGFAQGKRTYEAKLRSIL